MKSNLLTVKSVERLLRSGEGAMHNDGQGLFLKVLPSGAGSWIYRYRINGKRMCSQFSHLYGVPNQKPRAA